MSSKLGTKRFSVKEIQVQVKEGSRLFRKAYNSEILKIHWRISSIFLSRTTGLISTKFGTKHPRGKGISPNSAPFQGENFFFKSDDFWCLWNLFLFTGPILTKHSRKLYKASLEKRNIYFFLFYKYKGLKVHFIFKRGGGWSSLLIKALVNSSLHGC